MSAMSGGTPGASPLTTFAVDAFQADLFTGAATAELPILVPPGTAGAAPRIALRYNSSTVDELGPQEQGQGTGLGWTLDTGGFILRDTKGTTSTSDDTFKLVFGGASHDLVLDAPQNLYHTKDETFWRLQYDATNDYWTLTTKDGTLHRFGFDPNSSKANGLGQDLATPITYKYLLDQVTTTRGTGVRYAYAKQTATVASTGASYDQAVYPDRITYTYYNGLPVGGTAREVRFLRASRFDWTDTSTTTGVSFFEREQLDKIEVLVGADLVRRYDFTYDYSIDRDPTYTWGGGATGDLTLLSVTQVGANGSSTLQPTTFTYNTSARLASSTNGIGGIVSFTYERVTTNPLYSACMAASGSCTEWGASTTPDGWGFSTLLEHVLSTAAQGTVPVYSACLAASGSCTEWGVSTTPDSWGFSTLLGHVFSAPGQGTVPVYSACLAASGSCTEWGVSTTPDSWGFSTLLGHGYAGKVDRYRVASRSVSDGRGGTLTTAYSYNGLGLSSDGKEFRGHASVRAVDPLGHYTDTWFKQDDALKGRAYDVLAQSSTDAYFTRVINTWSTMNPYPGVTFVALSRADTYTYDGDATFKQTAQTFKYDCFELPLINCFGNPTEVKHWGDEAVPGDERTDVTEYAPPNTTAYIVGLPSHGLTRDSSLATVAETWFYYDGATVHTTPATIGNLTRRCHWFSGGTNPCVTMAYDAYGNVTATTDALGNPPTTTTYDATFRTFPATVTSPPTPNVPAGLVTTSVYDARFGVATSTTDPNNQTTTYAYDTFARLTSATNALGQTSTTSYDAFGTVGSQRVTTRLPDGSPDGLWSEAYFDGLGRTFKGRKEAAESEVVVLETIFDNRGLVSQKSLPRFEGDSPFWTTLAYDPLGRPTTTTYPDGTTETTTYSDWTMTATDRAGRTRSSLKDAYARVRQITEPGGAVTTYAYDPLGRLTAVTDAAGNVTSIAYDTLGRKISMTEPNMGTWAYAYDPNGNLTSQTDAKGQTLTFAYDALNRLTTKTYPGGATVSFTYDTGVNGKGRRTGMTDLAGSASYAYDALGRQVTGTRVTDGTAYTTQTTYTSLGQPASITYPDGEVVTYTYDTGGRVFSVAGAATYVSSMTYNAVGQVTTLRYGNGVASTWTYDPVTLRLSSIESYKSSLPLVALTSWTKSWQGPQHGYATLYRGGICVADGTGSCVGGDLKAEPGLGTAVGYLKTTADAGTVPVQRVHCYSSTAGSCTGWGLSLDTFGTLIGYLATTAQGTQSASAPLTQAGGLLLQGLSGGTPSAFLWTAQTVSTTAPHTDHLYASDGSTVPGYTAEGTIAYLHENADPGTVPLYRFSNTSTGHYYYSTTTAAPVGFTQELTLGYLETTASSGVVAFYRYFNATTGDYLLGTAPTPPTGYQLEATLGYVPAAAAFFQDLNYTYDPVGNVTAITDQHTPANNQAFTYDDLDRLTSATGAYGTQTYTYTPIGNLLSKAGVTYTYGATGQTCNRLMPHAVTSTSDGKSYSYDCNGNLLADGARTLTWDADNKPVSITLAGVGTTTLAYSGDGGRVKKVGPTRIVRYSGGFEDHLTETAQVKHIMAGGLRVATRVVSGGPNAGTYFVHGDHLGSLHVLTNSQGAEVQRLSYRPWGETQSNTGTVDFDQRRFTGQEQDPETGLYFYQARYYNPELGRFLSPDPLVPGAGDPQNLNRYSYANNNPVNFTDPTGHFSFKKFFKKIIPIIVGIAAGIALGPAGLGLHAIVAGAAGGFVAGATGALVNGGNVLRGAIVGAMLGSVAGGLAGPIGTAASVLGDGLGAALATAAGVGAAMGAIGTAVAGGNALENMLLGALTAVAVTAAVSGAIEVYERVNQSPALAEGKAQTQSKPAFMNDPHVVKELDRAWLESKPFAPEVPWYKPGSLKTEQGGWIVRDPHSGWIGDPSYEVIRVAPGTRASLPTIAGTRPSPASGVVEGWFHTHPNTAAEGYRHVAGSGDIDFTRGYATVPGVIMTHGGLQVIPYP